MKIIYTYVQYTTRLQTPGANLGIRLKTASRSCVILGQIPSLLH